MNLAPCPACRRHVTVGTTCPFCASAGPPPSPRASSVGRLSRAMVFGAALGATAACGGKAKPAVQEPVEEQHHGGGGCLPPDQQRIADLEKQKTEATTDEERIALEQELENARQPACMPYGAPPRRRRIV